MRLLMMNSVKRPIKAHVEDAKKEACRKMLCRGHIKDACQGDSGARQLKRFEDENHCIKLLVAALTHKKQVIQEILRG